MRFFLCLYFFIVSSQLVQSKDVDLHAIYLSTIDIKDNGDQLNIVIKVFEDDLRDELRNFHGHLIDANADSFSKEISDYFNHHFKIQFDNNIQSLLIKSVELVGESYQIYFVIRDLKEVLNVAIEASYFFDLFPTQQNVLNFHVGGTKKYHIFRKGSSSKIFSIVGRKANDEK